MGDMADEIDRTNGFEHEYYDSLFSEERTVPPNHWMTNQGEIIAMKYMTTTHLLNCIKFAGPTALKEIDAELKSRITK